jgi:hypothetical protein
MSQDTFGDMLGVFGLMLGMTVVVLLLWRTYALPKRKLQALFARLAEELGLIYRTAGGPAAGGRGATDWPRVAGTYRDREVSVTLRWTSDTHDGRTEDREGMLRASFGMEPQVCLRAATSVEGLGSGWMLIADRCLFERIARSRRVSDPVLWRSGDHAFDEALCVHTSRTDLACATAFRTRVRRDLVELLAPANQGRITLRDGQIRWESLRTDCDHRLLVLAVNVICELAECVETRAPKSRAAPPRRRSSGARSLR